MADTKSFFDVLEQQIRTDLRREIEAEVRAEMGQKEELSRSEPRDLAKAALADRLETWLLTNVVRPSFSRKAAYEKTPAQPQPIPTPAPRTPVTEPTITIATVEATCALELLLRHSGSNFASSNSLSESQLKTVWRRAALKTHPDRFTGEEPIVQLQKAALFRELVAAYECLQHLFDQSPAA